MPTARLARYASVLALATASLANAAPTTEEQAVLAPIQAMFEGMTQHNPAAIKAQSIPGASMVLMRDGKPVQFTVDAFADRLGKPSPGKIEERIHDPLVRIDNDLAVVWAPFDFLEDGKVSHCGTDLFSLVKINGAWRITSIADTSQNTCSTK